FSMNSPPLQCRGKQASSKVKSVLAWLDPGGIPVDPDGAARPWARPLFPVVGTPALLAILTEKLNPSLHVQHVWLSHPFGFFTSALPELKYLPKREHMVGDVLAHANVPAVVLANMNAQGVRSHDHTCSNITVAE